MTTAYEFPPRPAMTVREVAEAFGVHPNHVYRTAKKGGLPSVSVGRSIRFPTAEIKRLLAVETEKPDSAPTEPGLS